MSNLEMAQGPFDNKYRPSAKTPAPSKNQHNPFFNDLLVFYEEWLGIRSVKVTPRELGVYESGDSLAASNLEELNPILTPADIETFLPLTQLYESESCYNRITGQFLTSLIKIAHNSGHNEFNLNFNGLRACSWLCNQLLQKDNEPLSVRIRGKLDQLTASFSRGGTYYIDAARSEVGYGATNATFYIKDAGLYPGIDSQNCHFYVEKLEMISRPAQYYPANSTFHTPDRDTYNHLQKYWCTKVIFEPDWAKVWPTDKFND